MKSLISFSVGLIFAIGLGLSGMTQVQTVKGFLDIFGNWNPALLGVMLGAIGIHSIFYHLMRKRSSPLLETKFHIPNRKDIDKKLLLGAALFGIGWGWGGICPGPGIVAALSGNFYVLTFIVSMISGMIFFKLIEKKLTNL